MLPFYSPTFILLLAFGFLYYRIGQFEGGSGWPWAEASIFISVAIWRWLGGGWLAVILGQIGLFVAVTLFRSRRQVDLHRLSFQGTVDSIRQFSAALAQARSGKRQRQLIRNFLQATAADLVPYRPGRREPRAVKRRPNPCAYLTKPRHKFKDSQHRNRYWKNNPRKPRT